MPKVTLLVSVELDFQCQFLCWRSPSTCSTSLVSQAGKNCRAFSRSILNLSHSSSEQMLSFQPWFTFPSSRKTSQILAPRMLFRTVLLPAWLPSFLSPFSLSGEDQVARAASVPWETLEALVLCLWALWPDQLTAWL